MSALVFRRAFAAPIRSPVSRVLVVLLLLACWLSSLSLVIAASDGPTSLRTSVGMAVTLFSVLFMALAFFLGGMLFPRDIYSGMTELLLMLPVSRTAYYTAQVAGTLAFLLACYCIAASGFCVLSTYFAQRTFSIGTEIFWPEVWSRLLFLPLRIICIVLSLSALSVVASSRYIHFGFWMALQLAIVQADVPQTEHAPWRFVPLFLVHELLQPVLTGPRATFIDEAALGSWYLWRAMLDGLLGAALGLAAGLFAFHCMEVSTRR